MIDAEVRRRRMMYYAVDILSCPDFEVEKTKYDRLLLPMQILVESQTRPCREHKNVRNNTDKYSLYQYLLIG